MLIGTTGKKREKRVQKVALTNLSNYCRVQEAPKDLSKAQASEEDDNQGFVGLNSLKNILPSFFNRDQVLVISNK